MITETKSFSVYCDRCGEPITNSDADAKIYSTEQDAEVDVDFQGWTRIQISGVNLPKVIHLCPACAVDTLKALDKALTRKRRLTK